MIVKTVMITIMILMMIMIMAMIVYPCGKRISFDHCNMVTINSWCFCCCHCELIHATQEMKEAESKMEEGALAPSELDKQQRERESFLSQQRDIIKGRHRPSHHRPLSRTQSSPLVTFSVPPQQPTDSGPVTYNFTTGWWFVSLCVVLY